ncbi:MAG: hypothetical protein HY716_16930 [Planctomycetes bacterium]|nr:hypothetical protein [Planctomycetota bacterium]
MRGRRYLVWSLVGFALIGVVLLVWIVVETQNRRTEALVKRHEAQALAQIDALKAADASRPPLFEPAIDSNAWDYYRLALDAIDGMPASDRNLLPSLRDGKSPAPDARQIDEVLGRYDEVAANLREALSCRRVEPGYAYEQGFLLTFPYLIASTRTANFLSDAMVHRHAQGRDREAVDLAVIGLGMSRDVARKGFLIHHMVRIVNQNMVLSKLREVLERQALSSSDLAWLGGALDRIDDGSLPLSDVFAVEFAMFRVTLLGLLRGGGSYGGVAALLGGASNERGLSRLKERVKRFFSSRMTIVDALEIGAQHQKEMEAIGRLAAHERAEAAKKVETKIKAAGNEIVDSILPQFSRISNNTAEADLNFQLARMAVAVARHHAEKGSYPAAIEDLAPRYLSRIPLDPLTGRPFRYRAAADEATVYSLGGDGDDDGGKPVSGDGPGKDGDVVWKVGRR